MSDLRKKHWYQTNFLSLKKQSRLEMFDFERLHFFLIRLFGKPALQRCTTKKLRNSKETFFRKNLRCGQIMRQQSSRLVRHLLERKRNQMWLH